MHLDLDDASVCSRGNGLSTVLVDDGDLDRGLGGVDFVDFVEFFRVFGPADLLGRCSIMGDRVCHLHSPVFNSLLLICVTLTCTILLTYFSTSHTSQLGAPLFREMLILSVLCDVVCRWGLCKIMHWALRAKRRFPSTLAILWRR